MADKKSIKPDKPSDGKLDGNNKQDTGSAKHSKSNDRGSESEPIDAASLPGGDGNFGESYRRDGDGNIVYNADGKPSKKRGRKPGGKTNSKPKPKNYSLEESINGLSGMLSVFHLTGAGLLKFPDFVLDKSEAKILAEATAKVMQEYEIKPNPKVTAIAGLIGAASQIYVPRYYLYKKLKKDERKKVDDNLVITPTKSKRGKSKKGTTTVYDNPNNFNLNG